MLNLKYSTNILGNYFENSFYIDSIRKNNSIGFITHAHKDHITSSYNNKVFLTQATLDILNIYGLNPDTKILEYNKKYKFDDLEYKIINSGHVLGSYSLILEYNGTKINITSDLNTLPTTVTKEAKIEDCDILIIESTYGSQKDVFPNKDKEYNKLLKWITFNKLNNRLPIIGAYPLGKTQELVKLISDNTNYNIGLTNEAYDICNVYQNHNIKMKNYYKINGNLNDLDLLILNPSKINKTFINALSITCKKNLAFATTSGMNFNIGEKFNISNHSDINQLLNYIDESNAKTIYTYHGKDIELSNIINKKLSKFSKPLKEVKKIEII
jgi:putative mRNA 3-end processing factor